MHFENWIYSQPRHHDSWSTPDSRRVLKNYNSRGLPTRLPLGYSSPFKDTFYYVGPGTISIFGLSFIDFTRCVPGYKTRSYLFSTPRIRRESIRQEWALSLIRRYPSAGFSCGRPHCDVCGWTEVSLSPGRVIAHWSRHLPFGSMVLSLALTGSWRTGPACLRF